MTELKPCPFCGGKLLAIPYCYGGGYGHLNNGCVLSGLEIKDVEAWNRRASDDAD